MNLPEIFQPTLRVNRDPSERGSGSVSICCLGPDLVAFLGSSKRESDLLRSIFRVSLAEEPSAEVDGLPDVSGRFVLYEDELQFIPHFPFERGVKYRACFDPRPLGTAFVPEPLNLEFVMAAEETTPAPTDVTQVFPSSVRLPENLLRFYVCFSNSMLRGRALEEISLLDSDGRRVADALYRPPLELWDRTMRRLTVLLDPGRLKRWVGPNVRLGPPLKAGQEYCLEIGSGMLDHYGRPLRERFRKHFHVGDPVRECISIEDWKILPPVTGSRRALVLMFPSALDWALLFQTIKIRFADGSGIDGQVAVDECERQWSFTPNSPWIAGVYHILVESSLEDVCGNTLTGAFDRPLQRNPHLEAQRSGSRLVFQLI